MQEDKKHESGDILVFYITLSSCSFSHGNIFCNGPP